MDDVPSMVSVHGKKVLFSGTITTSFEDGKTKTITDHEKSVLNTSVGSDFSSAIGT
jgi:hypothetical protein